MQPEEKRNFASPFTGVLCPITEAPDPVFAGKMMGDGFFMIPEDGAVLAPEDSTVDAVMDTKHAMGLTTRDGVEYLLHIGIDTVKLQGKGFTVFVKPGQVVKKGEKLLEFDAAFLKAQAPSDACLCVFPSLAEGKAVILNKEKHGKIHALDVAVQF